MAKAKTAQLELIIRTLNSAIKADPVALGAVLRTRIPANAKLAGIPHATVPVTDKDVDVVTGLTMINAIIEPLFGTALACVVIEGNFVEVQQITAKSPISAQRARRLLRSKKRQASS